MSAWADARLLAITGKPDGAFVAPKHRQVLKRPG